MIDNIMLKWLEENSKCMKCEHKCDTIHISNIYNKTFKNVPFCSKHAIDISPDSEEICCLLEEKSAKIDKLNKIMTEMYDNFNKFGVEMDDEASCANYKILKRILNK